MRLDSFLQELKVKRNTNIPIHSWIKPLQEQKEMLSEQGLPESMAIQWTKTEGTDNEIG